MLPRLAGCREAISAKPDRSALFSGRIPIVTASPATCYCGVDRMADCLRCGQPRCGSHYYLSIARDRYDPHWIAQTPIGAQGLGLEIFDIVYNRGFLAGGPGCVKCRTESAQSEVAQAHERCRSFVARPSGALLRDIARDSDTLTAPELDAIGKSLRTIAPDVREVTSVACSPAKKRLFGGRGDKAVVQEAGRTEVGWFPTAGCAVDQQGRIYSSLSRWGMHAVFGGSTVAVTPGTKIQIRYVPGRSGPDATGDGYKAINVDVLRRVEVVTGQYAYANWDVLRKALEGVAKDLRS